MKKYIVEDILTWGLKLDDKYGGYKLPVSFKYHEDVVEKIEKSMDKYKCKNTFYGNSKTLYFKVYNLTEKQRDEILDKGTMYIDIVIEEENVAASKKGFNYLQFKLLSLKKSENQHTEDAPKDTLKVVKNVTR